MKILIAVFLLSLLISGCTDVKASSPRTIECETVVSEVAWQADTVCGVDKLGRQMVSIGGFENIEAAPEGGELKSFRNGCVSISRHCTITE